MLHTFLQGPTPEGFSLRVTVLESSHLPANTSPLLIVPAVFQAGGRLT